MPRIALLLIPALVFTVGSSLPTEAASCDAKFVVTDVNFPPASHITRRQRTTIRARLTGRCLTGSKPDELKILQLVQLQNLGYYDAEVLDPDMTVIDSGRHPQPVSLTLRFNEGSVYRVRDITWSGTQAISTDRIASISDLRAGDVLSINKVEEVLDTVRLLYHALGFLDVTITPKIHPNKERHWAVVNYEVSEGAQYP